MRSNVILFFLVFGLISCNSLPSGDSFKYAKGEVVYYKIDNVPMLVDKPIYKNGEKKYRVVFKNDDGMLQYATVSESEIIISPPQKQ